MTINAVFADYRNVSYPYTFHGRIHVPMLVGGVPDNPDVIKGWLESKIKDNPERIQQLIATTMVEKNITADEAVEEVKRKRSVNGFKKDPEKGLYIEGRQLKAALKEAVSVAAAAEKINMTGWGATRKWLTKFLPEHVFVVEERLYLGTHEPTDILQQFVHARNQSSIQYQEYVTDAEFDFTVVTDWDFSDRDWAMIWTTGERNGLGASRSQGYGTYSVTKWDKQVDASVKDTEVTRVKAKKTTSKAKEEE